MPWCAAATVRHTLSAIPQAISLDGRPHKNGRGLRPRPVRGTPTLFGGDDEVRIRRRRVIYPLRQFQEIIGASLPFFFPGVRSAPPPAYTTYCCIPNDKQHRSSYPTLLMLVIYFLNLLLQNPTNLANPFPAEAF